jgi:hypothetical protein
MWIVVPGNRPWLTFVVVAGVSLSPIGVRRATLNAESEPSFAADFGVIPCDSYVQHRAASKSAWHLIDQNHCDCVKAVTPNRVAGWEGAGETEGDVSTGAQAPGVALIGRTIVKRFGHGTFVGTIVAGD